MTADKKLRPVGLEESMLRAQLNDALNLIRDWLRHSSAPLSAPIADNARWELLVSRSKAMLAELRGDSGGEAE